MKHNYNNICEVAEEIIFKAPNKNLFIFANNSIGKTSLSKCITDLKDIDEFFCYNTFMEETFEWVNDFDNDEFYLTINANDLFINEAVITNGLENRINEIFKSLIDAKIDSNFEIKNGKIDKVYFSIKKGDDSSISYIKISKGEESLFIWSVFCTIVEMALNDKLDENNFEKLNYIIIDDPISSLGEEKIVSVALCIRDIIEQIARIRNNNVEIGLLITTHSRLLYNVLFTGKNKEDYLRLFKHNTEYELVKQNESPFGYHIEEINQLKIVFDNNEPVYKIHFNMFRNILEKTSSFLGYGTNWAKCLNDGIEQKDKMIKLLNLYSHSRLFELDDKFILDDEKELFKLFFKTFLDDYKWS